MANISSPTQVDMMARSRAESCLDRAEPLGFPPPARAEFGPSAPEYFRRKHESGALRARFWPLHQTARMPR